MSATCAGITQWCMIGKHGNCAHRVGGSQESGVWMPECYLTIPVGNRSMVPPAPWGCSYPMVVRPSHTWRCGCNCHKASQMSLFGATA